jgi:hypothetical protein
MSLEGRELAVLPSMVLRAIEERRKEACCQHEQDLSNGSDSGDRESYPAIDADYAR